MGIYTELVLKITLPEKNEIKDVLDFMFDGTKDYNDELLNKPDHPFFKCTRWRHLSESSSYYLDHPKPVISYFSDFGTTYLFLRVDLKNYDDEIDQFIDFIKPHLEIPKGKTLGWVWYEEDDNPNMIIM